MFHIRRALVSSVRSHCGLKHCKGAMEVTAKPGGAPGDPSGVVRGTDRRSGCPRLPPARQEIPERGTNTRTSQFGDVEIWSSVHEIVSTLHLQTGPPQSSIVTAPSNFLPAF